jgi:hypothetical protein
VALWRQVTYSAKGSLESNYPGVDVFIRGYAEEAMCAVIGAMQHQQGTGEEVSKTSQHQEHRT